MASKRRIRKKKCGDKIKFASREESVIEARKTKLNAYKCEVCKCWHIGHIPQKLKEIIENRRGY